MKKISAIPHFGQLCVFTISSLLYTMNAWADTTNVKTQTTVEVTKEGEHCEQDPNCFNRVVDVPNYVVSTICPMEIFDE